MKILVTGGAGFIGSNVVDGFIAHGHDVVVVDNLKTGRAENINPKAKFYPTDIREDALARVFEAERPEVVNHHAAQISVPASVLDPAYDADVNVMGLLNLLECSRKYGVRKFVFISSGGAIYGEAPPDMVPTDESCPPRPLSPYAISKLISEHYLNFYRHQYGLDFTVLRYSNVYGPRQIPQGEAGVVAIFMEKLLNGELPTIYRYEDAIGGMIRDYCYVADAARANLLAVSGGSGEVFNIGTGAGTRTLELYLTILELMREKGYAKGAGFESPPDGPARPGDIRNSCLNVNKAFGLLGWRPEFNLRAGLKETLDWFLDKKV